MMTASSLHAQVQRELLERLQFLRRDPQRVLDLGCGAGAASVQLARAYPRSSIVALDSGPARLALTAAAAQRAFAAPALRSLAHRMLGRATHRMPLAMQRCLSLPPVLLCADAARLPLARGSVDLVFSSLMLQCCEDLDAVLAEVRRVLTPNGLLLVSTFGPDTLKELRQAGSAADDFNQVNRLLDVHDLGSALARAGFAEPVLDVDRVSRPCQDAHELLRGFELQRVNGLLPVTYEVIYGCAWAPAAASANAARNGEISIEVSQIGRRTRA